MDVQLPAGSDDALAVALFARILERAVEERASDVHLEQYGRRVRVRARVDGDLHELFTAPIGPDDLAAIVNVVKINAGLDISERRKPQGGRFSARVHQRVFDLRVQTQPALHAEHVVLRLLPQQSDLLRVEDLGFPDDLVRVFHRLIESPVGLVLVVGPTGSGKSTTLYAGLQTLAADTTRKVITVEDPIEYSLENVQQAQVKPELGFTFAEALRSFVREDPDVIMLGEVRDHDTALEALRASQTGHLVLSTLHCNDTVDAAQRLLDLGVHENSIASELLAVFAQRLAKRVCPACASPDVLDSPLVAEVFPTGVPDGFTARRGLGCEACRGRGTRGRIGVYEYLAPTVALRKGLSRRLPVDELRDLALADGLITMRDRALALVHQGVIAFDELKALLPPERLRPTAPRRPGEDWGIGRPSPLPMRPPPERRDDVR